MKTILERGKRMKKKGFTLIELLAVIVILAIIALIAVPVVMNIINKANKSAFKDSAYGILKAGESYYTSELLENSDGITEDVTFTFPNNIEGLEFQGSKPTGGIMTVRKDGKISLAIHNGKHCVTKGFEDEDIQISDDVNNCGVSNGGNTRKTLATLAKKHTFKKQVTATATLEDGTETSTTIEEDEVINVPACITNKTKCEAGTPVAVEVAPNLVYKFYVLNDDATKNEVTLIMSKNLYSEGDANGGRVTWINAEDYGNSTVKNNKGPLTALEILKQRTSGWTNIPAYTYTLTNDADGQGGANSYNQITKDTKFGLEESVVENVRARLPRREELTKPELGCTQSSGSCKQWLIDDGAKYWTSTINSKSSTFAWYMHSFNGYVIESGTVSKPSAGLRPVIILSK